MRRIGKQRAHLGDGIGAGGISEQPVVPDAMKAVGQDVKEEAAYELVRIERHDAVTGSSVAPVIFPFEADTLAIERDEAGIGDGDAMSVAGEIGEHLIWAGEGPLGIDKPIHAAERLEEFPEGAGIVKCGIGAEELQCALGVGGGKAFAHESAEQSREHLDAEEVPSSAGYPALPVERDAAARHDDVEVRMVGERRAPGVQHAGEPDVGS